jgi:type IV secretory pathway ATPase VirB11/archaellum biosynthesis ATPase
MGEVTVPGFDRILAAYEHGLQRLVDELVAELDPTDEERGHLLLASQLAQSVVRAYDSFRLDRGPALDAAKSVMYAAANQPERRVLNVPLRTLVDNNTLTGIEARLLTGSLNLRRTIIVSGGPNVGKSTLLNALVDMLPRDHRLVSINDADDELPALRDRSFAVQLTAKRGTQARASVFRKAADMQPTWIIAGELLRREGPAFFEVIGPNAAGLATVESPDPQLAITDWLSMSREVGEQLNAIKPLFAHMERDQGGRPRIQRLAEATVDGQRPVLTTFRPA